MPPTPWGPCRRPPQPAQRPIRGHLTPNVQRRTLPNAQRVARAQRPRAVLGTQRPILNTQRPKKNLPLRGLPFKGFLILFRLGTPRSPPGWGGVKSVVSVPPIQAAGRRRTAKPAAATGPKREGEKKGKKREGGKKEEGEGGGGKA